MANLILKDSNFNWQLTFQNPATPVMEGIIDFHNYVLMYLILVFVVICWFLLRSLYLFRGSKNSNSLDFCHDSLVETVWVVAPAFILIAIAMPSFLLLYSMDEITDPSLIVKVTPHEWYWSYELNSHSVAYSKSAEMFERCSPEDKNNSQLIDTNHASNQSYKFFSQIKFIFEVMLSDSFFSIVPNSLLYKWMKGLFMLITYESPLLKKLNLNGFDLRLFEAIKYFNSVHKANFLLKNAVNTEFDFNPYIKKQHQLIYSKGDKIMVVTHIKMCDSVVEVCGKHFKVQYKKDILPTIQNAMAVQGVFPKYDRINHELFYPLHSKGNSQQGFDYMKFRRDIGSKGKIEFGLELSEFKSKTYGLVPELRLVDLGRQSQIVSIEYFFRNLKTVAEFNNQLDFNFDDAKLKLEDLFDSNPFLCDYYVKKGPKATLQILQELQQYYNNDRLLTNVKINAGVMSRLELTEEVQKARLNQEIDYYGHIELVDGTNYTINTNLSTSLAVIEK